jgi:hypothetical protein
MCPLLNKTYRRDIPEPGMCVKFGNVGLAAVMVLIPDLAPDDVVYVDCLEGLNLVDPTGGLVAIGVANEIWFMPHKTVRKYTPRV